MLYLVVGQRRIPWTFRSWRGKETTTPAQLGLRLLHTSPKKLTNHFRVQVLAGSGFSSVEFLQGVRKLKHHAIVSIPKHRRLEDGRLIRTIGDRGEEVEFLGFEKTVITP